MKHNQSGFGLMETLISVAVLSVVTYGVMNQADLVGRVKGKAEFADQVTAITSSIKVALSDSTTCAAFVADVNMGTFNNSSPNGTSYSSTYGEAVGGEIVNRPLVSPFSVVPNPDQPQTGPPSQLYVPAPVLSWNADSGHYRRIDGIDIKKIQLVSDGFRNLLRITFEKPSILSAVNLGGSVVTKDIIIRGNKYPGLSKLKDCESESKISIKEFCLNSLGTTWTESGTNKCNFGSVVKMNPAVVTTKPLYLIDGKLLSDKLVISSTVSKSCSSTCGNCTTPPTCPAGTIPELPPRLVVNGSRILFPVIQINGPQRCALERHCYTKLPIPSGNAPVGKLIQ